MALIRGFLLTVAVLALLSAAYPHLGLSALLFALYRIIALLEQERSCR